VDADSGRGLAKTTAGKAPSFDVDHGGRDRVTSEEVQMMISLKCLRTT